MVTCSHISRRRSPVGDIGVEVEMEFAPGVHSAPDVTNWVRKRDGSLSNGCEYVTRVPVKIEELRPRYLDPLFSVIGNKIKTGVLTASTHIHLNMLRLTPQQLINTMFLYWMVEEILFDYCGDDRKGSHYSARFSDSNPLSAGLLGHIRDGHLIGSGGLGANRYSSLNLCAINKFGSLEYRGMRGGIKDPAIIESWIKAIYNIQYNMSSKYKNPIVILNKYEEATDKSAFLKSLIINDLHPHLNFTTEAIDRCEENILSLYDMAYCLGDETWIDWSKRVSEVKKKKRTSTDNPAGTSWVTIA